MAAALFRRGSGLCLRCIHRELCRVVWRPQVALFSSKPSDRKLQRRTHIKKAKPQPPLDVAKLLEQLFSQRRPGTAPPAATKAQPAKTSPSSSSSSRKGFTSDVPHLSKTEPAVSVSTAATGVSKKTASAFNTAAHSAQPQSASFTKPKTLFSSETPQQSSQPFIQVFTADGVPNTSTTSSGLEDATVEDQSSSKTIETKAESATELLHELAASPVLTSSANVVETKVENFFVPAAKVETIEEPAVESNLPSVEALETRHSVSESPVVSVIDVTVDTAAKIVQTKGPNSGLVDTVENTAADTSINLSAAVEGTEESTVEAEVDKERVVSISYDTKEEHLLTVELPVDTPVKGPLEAIAEDPQAKNIDSGKVIVSTDPSIEINPPSLEATALVKGPVESAVNFPVEEVPAKWIDSEEVITSIDPSVKTRPVDVTVDVPVEEVQVNRFSMEEVIVSIDPLTEANPPPLEARSSFTEGAVEIRKPAEADQAQAVQTIDTDSGVINISAEPTFSPLDSQTVVEGTVDPAIETQGADNLLHADKSAVSPLISKVGSTESLSGNETLEEEVKKSEQMTLESVTLHFVESLVESLKTDELLQTKFTLDEEAEKRLQELLVQTGIRAENETANEAENSNKEVREFLTEVLSKWDSLSEDLQELEGETGTLVRELLCHVPAVVSNTPDQCVGVNRDFLPMEQKATEEEAMTLESMTLEEVEAEVGCLETEVLQETSYMLEKKADAQAKEEKLYIEAAAEDVVFQDATEAEILTVDSISEAADALEAETHIILEAMLGSEQGARQVVTQDEIIGQEAQPEFTEQRGIVLEAMSLESVSLAEVEASLGTLEDQSLSETTAYLEKEAKILAGERREEAEEAVSEETIEALTVESLSLPEDDDLSEDLQSDVLMEELLFTFPGHVAREAQVGQEVVRANTNVLDATGLIAADISAAETDDYTASPAPKEVVLVEQEMLEDGAQTEASGDEGGESTLPDLDPVQKLFLEKIREYNNMHRLSGGPVEVESDYERHLSEETAKLQRLYGGGDLSSFPHFTFTEPKMDQDSK